MENILNLRLLASFLVVSGLALGCAPAPPKVDLGEIRGNTYTNPEFGFSITWPESWTVVDDKLVRELQNVGTQELAGSNQQAKREMDAALVQNVNLLFISEVPVDEAEDSCNLNITINRLPFSHRNTTAEAYLAQAKKELAAAGIPMRFVGDPRPIELGDHTFLAQDVVTTVFGASVNQRMYFRLTNGYSLNITLTYFNAEQEAKLREVVESYSTANLPTE